MKLELEEIYKTYFKELSKVLNEKTIDYTEYAKLISKLFVIDLYTLDNKLIPDFYIEVLEYYGLSAKNIKNSTLFIIQNLFSSYSFSILHCF